MNNCTKLFEYIKYYFFTLLSNVSPNDNIKSYFVIFYKSAYKNIKYSYKNIFKSFNNKKFKFSKGNYWDRCINHLNFIGKYYHIDEIHKSPLINLTVINFNYKNRVPTDLKNIFFNNERLNYHSKIISEKFSGVKFNNILQWYGAYHYTLSKNILSKKQMDITKNCNVLEIGPGLGLNSLIYSDINSKEIFFYDLEEMKEIQKKIENSFRKSCSINKIRYFDNIVRLKESLIAKDYYIVSCYAFSEFPEYLRNKFQKLIQNSKFSIFLSNEKFENVINHNYFYNLAKNINKNIKVKKFNYPSQDGFTKKHKYFIIGD